MISISKWNLLPARLPEAMASGCCFSYRNRLYIVGGGTGQPGDRRVLTAEIFRDGSLSPWKQAGFLPVPSSFGAAVVSDSGIVYVTGGTQGNPKVYASQISEDGTLKPFRIVNQLQNGFQSAPGMLIHNDWVYVVGGTNGPSNVVSAISRFRVGNEWQVSQVMTPLSIPRQFIKPFIYGGYMYVIGGAQSLTFPIDTDTVLSARIEADGSIGAWKQVGSLPLTLSRHVVIPWNDKVIVIGGRTNDTTNVDRVMVADLLPSGEIGTFKDLDRFPVAQRSLLGQSFLVGNRMYLCGGFTTVNQDHIYWADVSA